MPLPASPPLNISFSSVSAAGRCERRAALMGPGAWQAWPGGARARDPVGRLCYEGKNLQLLLSFLGAAIHRVAEQVVHGVVRAGRHPTAETLEDAVLGELRDLWRRPRRAFEDDPKLGMLLSRYAGRAESPAVIEKMKRRLKAAIHRLLAADLLEDLREFACPKTIQTEQLLQMPVATPGLPPATLFGKADVVYVHRRSLLHDGGIIAPGAEGIPVIVDFKTGRVDAERATLQLSVLALLLRAAGLSPHPVAGYAGRIVDLSQEGLVKDRMILIGPQELRSAEAWVRANHERVAALPRGEDGFVRLDEVPTTRGVHCATCLMQFACAALPEHRVVSESAA